MEWILWSLVISTTRGAPWPPGGLIDPLYTLPSWPSLIHCDLLKLFVAFSSSENENFLKACSFSLYNSGEVNGFCSGEDSRDLLLVLELKMWKKFIIEQQASRTLNGDMRKQGWNRGISERLAAKPRGEDERMAWLKVFVCWEQRGGWWGMGVEWFCFQMFKEEIRLPNWSVKLPPLAMLRHL